MWLFWVKASQTAGTKGPCSLQQLAPQCGRLTPRKTWEGLKKNPRHTEKTEFSTIFAVCWWGSQREFPHSAATTVKKAMALLKRWLSASKTSVSYGKQSIYIGFVSKFRCAWKRGIHAPWLRDTSDSQAQVALPCWTGQGKQAIPVFDLGLLQLRFLRA